MTQATHTSGHWEISQWTPTYDDIGGDYSVGYRDNEGTYWDIATLEPSRASRLADARLIAAAPDLLAALENMVTQYAYWASQIEMKQIDRDAAAMARAAITKAKGR